jgi:hypothetical protein
MIIMISTDFKTEELRRKTEELVNGRIGEWVTRRRGELENPTPTNDK